MKYCPDCTAELSRKYIDGFEREVCDNTACSFVNWNNPIAVVLVLVQLGDSFVLARNSLWPAEIYSFVSGYVDANESLEQTAIREVKEELGLKGSIKSYIGSYAYKHKNQIVAAYWLSASGEIRLNHEIADVKLLSLQELLHYDFGILEISRNVIRDWKGLSVDKR